MLELPMLNSLGVLRCVSSAGVRGESGECCTLEISWSLVRIIPIGKLFFVSMLPKRFFISNYLEGALITCWSIGKSFMFSALNLTLGGLLRLPCCCDWILISWVSLRCLISWSIWSVPLMTNSCAELSWSCVLSTLGRLNENYRLLSIFISNQSAIIN